MTNRIEHVETSHILLLSKTPNSALIRCSATECRIPTMFTAFFDHILLHQVLRKLLCLIQFYFNYSIRTYLLAYFQLPTLILTQ